MSTIDTAVPAEPAAPEVTTPIRPSEALRLGRLTYPIHIRHTWTDDEDGACALGAIYQGYGYWTAPRDTPSPLDGLTAACPMYSGGCGYFGYGQPTHPLEDTVMHLNDHHEWSDRRIVHFLESLGL